MAPPFLQRRLFSSSISSAKTTYQKWSIKQVTKANFHDSLEELRAYINSSDFVAVSLRNTGSSSATWHRVSPFDTPETAYLKVKYAADRFQILQFAVCPFSVEASKITAHPYNFHLFPKDELKLGMPSYSFSCQASYLTAMAREGFDFNTCIYDGISYLSRAQESAAKAKMGNPLPAKPVMTSSSPSVADTIFMGRIKSRLKHWKNAFTDSTTQKDVTDTLVNSLRKLILKNEEYGSRPCMTIDVCSERQVQLVLKVLSEFFDDLVPLIVASKSGGSQAVRVVLTSSQEDKELFERELLNLESEQNKRLRGFREVIDLISASQKPVVSHNSLDDFTLIHSKFIGPLPQGMNEFTGALRPVFPHVLDVNHLMKKIVPLSNGGNIPAAMSYLKNRFFAPVDIEIPDQATTNEGHLHGHNVLRICELFVKLCSVLKITPDSGDGCPTSPLREYANIFSLCPNSPQEALDEDVRVFANNSRKVSCENLVFVWGFNARTPAGMLKSLLQNSHEVFSEEFDVRLVDRSCAIIVFWQAGLSKTFLSVLSSPEVSGTLREMVADGLTAAGYETYKRTCQMGLWGADLADSLEKSLVDMDSRLEADSETKLSEVYWCSESVINFDDL